MAKKSPRMLKKLAAKAEQVACPAPPAQPAVVRASTALPAKVISLPQLMERAKRNNAKTFGDVADPRALVIARAFFLELNRALEELQEGAVLLPVLGTFSIEQLSGEADGQKYLGRCLYFQVSQPKNEG